MFIVNINKNFVLPTIIKKNIRNSKYLFFILKNKLFETLAFLSYLVGDIWLFIGEGGICTHEKFTKNNAYK